MRSTGMNESRQRWPNDYFAIRGLLLALGEGEFED
jgi:hypothetical protein